MKIREAALRRALSYVGVTEHPPGSNRGPNIDVWNIEAGVPVGSFWCCSFMHAMFKKAANYSLGGGASVANLVTWAGTCGFMVKRPRRGDLVCYGNGEHIGQVIRVLALRWDKGTFTGWLKTVEGNTSTGAAGSQSNGGGVFIRYRWVSKWPAVFVRVPGDVRK